MLYRRGKTYWFKFKFAGRLFQESARTRSKTLARAAELERRRSLEEGIHGIRKRPRPVLFRIAADEWLALRETTVAPSTYAIERARLAHLKPALGHLLICDIDVDATVAYRERRLRQGAAKKTCNLEVGVLRSILQQHRLWLPLQADVKQRGIRLMLKPRTDVGRSLDRDERQRLIEACTHSEAWHLLPIVALALLTGLRRGEIRLLRWRQVDLIRRIVTVGESKTEAGTGRLVPLNAQAAPIMTFWAQRWPRRRPDHYVFPRVRSGRPPDPTHPLPVWKRAWSTARRRAKVSCRFHDLRHSCVTSLLEGGAPFSVVAALMGWSASTTAAMANRYGHIGEAALRRAVEVLDEPSFSLRVPPQSQPVTPPDDRASVN